MKSSLWTFGALPAQSHIQDSPSFRWLKQTWVSCSTQYGALNVMNVSSGEETLPLPRLHELRGRLTHPANEFQRLQVHATIDAEYKTVIKNDCEDWIIAVGHFFFSMRIEHSRMILQTFWQLSAMPLEHRQRLLTVNMNYMHRTLEIDALAFKQAGYVTCPHARISWSCPYQDSTFDTAAARMGYLCRQLIDMQANNNSVWMATFPQRHLAREMGELHYQCRHAYGLLTTAEYKQYHSVSFPALTSLRPMLVSSPAGTIWNYLDPIIKTQAVRYRLENPAMP
ncbi:hypothetical protein B0H10DRAFT_2187752 [Mycena sp. CBHHK59/15]|nr:hypothetical protein B0H10DRAFT_2187752 [Mycena sp. CBHHK59/15]